MKTADMIIVTTFALALPVWVYSARQQWSRQPGSTARMLKSGGLFAAIVLTGMLIAYLLS